MSWRAISDGRRVLRKPDPEAAQELLPRGTFLVELPFLADGTQRQVIVDLHRKVPWEHRFRLTLGAAGDLLLEAHHGHVTKNAFAEISNLHQGDDLRITVSWNAPERIGLISIENLKQKTSAIKVFTDPLPWTLGDAAFLAAGGSAIDPNVTVIAVSDTIEPTGLAGGFVAGTMVDTPHGPKQIETLKAGDEVQTSEHGVQPIRQVVSYEVPSAGWFAPIHLTAPFFGLERDLAVAPDHRLLVSGIDAEYLFGTEEVLIEAHYLKRLAQPVRKTKPATVRYVHIIMDAHVCLSLGGAWGESLYLKDMSQKPAQHAVSFLANTPLHELPKHTRVAGPQLQGYEAIVLVSALCA